ncbi:MAG: mechanosensitive ion channel family protein [Verrucomicrobiota bacterium]
MNARCFTLLALVASCLVCISPISAQPDDEFVPITSDQNPAEIAGMLEEITVIERGADDYYLLHPADTSSPRDTLISFLKLTQRYYDLISADDFSASDLAERAHLFEQMEGFFDLREVPPSFRDDYASATAVYLREVLDRVGIPEIEDIPDEESMHAAIEDGYPPRWQMPNTPFEIIRIEDGQEEGNYLFTLETSKSARPLFYHVRHLPYVTDDAEDFYYYYFLTPNPLIPRAWVESLPAWMLYDFMEQTIWQWLSMIVVLVLAASLVLGLHRLVRRISGDWPAVARHSVFLVVPASAIASAYGAHNLIDDKIFITGAVFQVVVYLIYTSILVNAVIIAFVLGTVLSDLVSGSEKLKDRTFDAHLARLGIRIVSIIACITILIEGLHYVGFSIATVIAGAGVTGLAVALAAQNTLRNIFGSLMILLDKPFRVGQRVKIGSADGTVEEIGLRSTKIRLLNGHMTTIPNDKVADAEIENIGMRPYIRRVSSITITYDTPQEKIPLAVDIIREVLSVPEGYDDSSGKPHPMAAVNHPDFPPRVFFNELNADSLNILMIYWHHPPQYWDFLELSQQINEAIMKRYGEAGIEFAFPTQTIHIAGENAVPFPGIQGDDGDVASTS